MTKENNNSYVYFLGGLFGALIGLAGVYLLEKSGEFEGEENSFTGKKISKIGLAAVTFLYTLIGKDKGKGKFNLN